MKIVIFGANGPVGKILTQQAVTGGNQTRAVTRHSETFPIRADRLEVVRGDVLVPSDVARAVDGQEVVLSLFGAPYTFKPVTVYSHGMAHILDAMQASGVRRLDCVTSGGTNPRHDPDEGFVFGWIIKPLVGRTLYADMRRMEDLVMRSDRDWTIVRPARLVDTPTVTPYCVHEGYMVPGLRETSRADLADFMLKQAESTQYIHKAVAVAYQT
jgi:putative NADH-flavin reductase